MKNWLALLIFCAGIVAADSVELKNGSVFAGKIIFETKTCVVMKIGGSGRMRIDKSRIKKIDRGIAETVSGGAADVSRRAQKSAAPPQSDTAADVHEKQPQADAESTQPDPSWKYVFAHRYGSSSDPKIEEQIKKIVKPGKESVDAVIALREFGEKAEPAIPHLLRMLGDPRIVMATDTSAYWIGYGGLAGKSGYCATEKILAKEAAYTLSKIGERALYPTLQMLKDGKPVRRMYAAMSLSWNRTARKQFWKVRDDLLACFNDTDPKVRGHAVYTLAVLGPPEAVNDVVPRLLDEDRFVRRRALSGVEYQRVPDELHVEPLLSGLRDSRPEVRRYAAEAFAELAKHLDDSRVDAALRYAAEDPDPGVRRFAAQALGKRPVDGGTGSTGNTYALVGNTDDSDAGVRREAVKALRGTTNRTGILKLIEALKDPDAGVREEAASSLRKTGNKGAVRALIEALDDPEPRVVKQAISTLGTTGDLSAVRPVFEISVKISDVSRTADRALSALGRKSDAAKREIARFLIPKLDNEDKFIRYRAARALFNVRTPIAIDALARATRDADGLVRKTAAEALGLMRDKRVIPHLIPLLEDPDEEVKKKTYHMLRLVSRNYDLPDERGAWQAWWNKQ